MTTITLQEAKSKYRWYMMGLVKLVPEVPKFFRSFFTDKESAAYGTNFEIVRAGRKVFDDIDLNAEPNINRLDKSTDKFFVPPYYAEGTTMDALHAFFRQVGQSSEVSEDAFIEAMNPAVDVLQDILDGYDRTEELLCAQVLLDGVLTLKDGTVIDFKRRGGSKIAYDAANDFGIDTVNPTKVLETMGDFLVQYGQIGSGNVINIVFGTDAWAKFENNPFIKEKVNYRWFKDIELVTGVQSAEGGVSKGVISSGAYTFSLWVYTATYKSNTTGLETPFMPTDTILALPQMASNVMFYGGIPTWQGDPYQSNVIGVSKGKRVPYEFKDVRRVQIEEGYKMRPLPIPRMVDRVCKAIVTNINQTQG